MKNKRFLKFFILSCFLFVTCFVPNLGGSSVSAETAITTWDAFVTAVTNAETNTTITIGEDLTVASTLTIADKNITIEGSNKKLDNSTWLKNVFTVNAGATLTINNLTIDNGADTWAVDYDNINVPTNKNYAYIYLKDYSEEAKTTASTIISNGELNATNLTIQNTYNTNVRGSAINIQKGTAVLDNCDFIRNAGQVGGAINTGSNLDTTAETVVYPVSSVIIKNCDFTNNYSKGRGGAVNAFNTANLEIKNCNFTSNTAGEAGNGGAVMYDRQSGSTMGNWSKAEDYNLDYPNLKIDTCVFDGNYCGNDGSAIENEDAESHILNSTFKNNVGAHPNGGSVGTLSYQIGRVAWGNQVINGCKFENNKGSVSGIGDHAGSVIIDMSDTSFTGNSGSSSVLLYSAITTMDNVTFTNENVATTVIDARSYNSQADDGIYGDLNGPSLTLKDSTITGTVGGSDVLVRSYKYGTDRIPYEVNFEGTTTANVDVWGNNNVTVSGNHTGDIVIDATASTENVLIATNATLNGSITKSNTYGITVKYSDAQGTEYSQLIDLQADIVYTTAKMQELLNVSNDGYILNWYTDNAYTTAWDYKAVGNLTLYGQWEAHTHDYTEYVVEGNTIYEACSCGANNGNYLKVSINDNFVYDGTSKSATVSTNIQNAEYSLTYYVKENGVYNTLDIVPVNAGEYKAVVVYNYQKAEVYFEIQKATYDLSNIKFENLTVKYDGKAHNLVVTGNLPEGLTATYVNNNNTEEGVYLVKVSFVVDNNHNEIEDMYAVLTIEKSASAEIIPYILSALVGIAVAILAHFAIMFYVSKRDLKKQNLNAQAEEVSEEQEKVDTSETAEENEENNLEDDTIQD